MPENKLLTMKKGACLALLAGIYVLAFAAGLAVCLAVKNTVLKYFIFDIAATVVTFVFSLLFHNSSVYDAYWSLTPMVMAIWLFVSSDARSVWQILFLIVFCIWSVRLTVNWITVFTGFSYEDWRYRKYREENSGFLWFVINFFGIHLVPTLVVFAGMLPLFVLVRKPMNALSLIGMAVMLCGVAFEFFADRSMHRHLAQDNRKSVCREGLWKYSRHPNYLGEITVWFGVFVTMLTAEPGMWYYGAGFVCVALLFNVVSIPLMEKRQLARRPEYAGYTRQTSRLLLLPPKK